MATAASPTPINPVIVTKDDRGPVINLVTWTMMVAMCLSVLTKVASNRTWKLHQLPIDNLFITVAMVCGIGESIAVTEQVSAGLGRRAASLDEIRLDRFQKAEYASQILYIVMVGFNKITTLSFMLILTQHSPLQRVVVGLLGFTGLWTTAGLFATAFQCDIPTPWAVLSDRCFQQTAYWTAIGVLDIIIQMAVVVLPILTVWKLHMPWSRKSPIMVAFACRSLVIPLTVLRLIYIKSANSSPDRTFSEFNAVLTTQIGVNLDSVLTCLPFLRTFMDRVQHGVFTSDLRNAPGYGSNNMKAYALESLPRSKATSSGKSKKSSGLSSWQSKSSGKKSRIYGTETGLSTVIARGDEDAVSRASSGHSEALIIKQTLNFSVQSEGPSGSDRIS